MARERAWLGGRWELGQAIGAGGSATVFRAEDHENGTEVAIKLVPPDLGTETVRTRIFREAEALKLVRSRFVAKVLDVGRDASGGWLVMELVDGVPLAPESLGRALFPHEVLRVARGVLEGLSAAHAAGLIHRDVKPSNILVPLAKDGLDSPKLIDFGLADPPNAEALADAPPSGVALGTALYMAPEVLEGQPADRRSDLYSVGLVLFELLGEGPLFPGETTSDRLRARRQLEPQLEGRVPLPLSAVLAKLLARDPQHRFVDADDALAHIVDLDTAPVSVVGDDIPPQSIRRSSSAELGMPPPLAAKKPHISSIPIARHSSMRPAPRVVLTALPVDAVTGLRETLRFLDLAMLDALARRERANVIGRIARACALALRLELDAAALVLEPLAMQSDVARAVGAALLAPRARRVTRARVDSDRGDKWVDTLPVELAGLFAALAAALSGKDDAARDGERCQRVLDRLAGAAVPESERRIETLRVTLRIAIAACRVKRGELDAASARDLVQPLDGADRSLAPFDRVIRSMLLGSLVARVDETRARDELERAVQMASQSGATLLEACASAAWGRLLVDAARIDSALGVLERAATLLAHGDLPALEHEAEHHRAAALLVSQRWDDAIGPLRRAREAAHAERAIELEIGSASLEVLAHLARGKPFEAHEAAATLGEARIVGIGGQAATFAWVARSLDALVGGETMEAETALAEARARSREDAGASVDAFVLVDVLSLLFEAARGDVVDVVAASSELEHFAQERGFRAFHWFDLLRATLDHVPDDVLRRALVTSLDRVSELIGPGSRLSRERRTSAPPRL